MDFKCVSLKCGEIGWEVHRSFRNVGIPQKFCCASREVVCQRRSPHQGTYETFCCLVRYSTRVLSQLVLQFQLRFLLLSEMQVLYHLSFQHLNGGQGFDV